jgi:hypothetical protein
MYVSGNVACLIEDQKQSTCSNSAKTLEPGSASPRLAPRFGERGRISTTLAKETKKKREENWRKEYKKMAKIDARVGGAGREASSYQGDHPTHPIRPEVGRLLGIRVLGGHS